MRMFNNYNNSYESKTRISEIRGLTNEFGFSLDSRKEEYNEDDIIKSKCISAKSNLKKKK